MDPDRFVETGEEPFNPLPRRLRILIPAYNEGNRIAPMIEDYCSRFASTATVMVIANACVDNTVELVEALAQKYRNLQLLVINGRIGKGGAIRAGLNIGAEDYVGFVDADGSTGASEFARLYDQCIVRNSDAVIGSRWLQESVVMPRQPFYRRFASRAFNLVVRALFGLKLSDTQCGAKIFRRSAIAKVLPSLELANFAFDIDLLFKFKRAGFSIEEVATRWSDTIGTKVRIVPASLEMLAAVLRLRLQESWILRFPFADLFASSCVIPVRNGTRLLIIGDRNSAPAWARGCIDRLGRRGCSMTWSCDIARSNASLVWWYLFKSRREYDAIVDIAAPKPGIIPLFTAKRCFVLQNGERRRRIYRAVHQIGFGEDRLVAHAPLFGRIELQPNTAERAAHYIWEQIGAGVLYTAEFQRVGDGWDLRFSDMKSGLWTSKTLK